MSPRKKADDEEAPREEVAPVEEELEPEPAEVETEELEEPEDIEELEELEEDLTLDIDEALEPADEIDEEVLAPEFEEEVEEEEEEEEVEEEEEEEDEETSISEIEEVEEEEEDEEAEAELDFEGDEESATKSTRKRKKKKKVKARPTRARAVRPGMLSTVGFTRSALETVEAAKKTWAQTIAKVDTSAALTYRITDSYRTSDVISHPRFGLGIVNQQLGATKIEVLFQDGLRKLVCSIQS